jgi:hypothetical protein
MSSDATSVPSLLRRYLELVTGLAPHYAPQATAPTAAAGADDAALAQLAAAVGRPIPAQIAELYRTANGVAFFDMFSVHLHSIATIATTYAADSAWLHSSVDEVVDDTDDDELAQLFEGRQLVLAGSASHRADLILFLLPPDPSAEWQVTQLVNGRWWEVAENAYPDVPQWLAALISGREADPAWKRDKL